MVPAALKLPTGLFGLLLSLGVLQAQSAAPAGNPREGANVPAPPTAPAGLGISGTGAVHTPRWAAMNAKVTGSAVRAGLIPDLKPLLPDTQLRDTIVILGGDGNYYLTGSSGNDIWDHNDGVELWRSADLKQWDYLGLVWTFEHDARAGPSTAASAARSRPSACMRATSRASPCATSRSAPRIRMPDRRSSFWM